MRPKLSAGHKVFAFSVCGGKGEGLQKDAQRVANVSQLTATPAPFQTTLRRLSGGLLGIAGSERGAAPQGFPGLLDAWHSAKLAAGADAAAAVAAASTAA